MWPESRSWGTSSAAKTSPTGRLESFCLAIYFCLTYMYLNHHGMFAAESEKRKQSDVRGFWETRCEDNTVLECVQHLHDNRTSPHQSLLCFKRLCDSPSMASIPPAITRTPRSLAIALASTRTSSLWMASSNVPFAAITEAAPQQPKIDAMGDFGDFVSTEDQESDLHDVAEPWHRYDIKDDPRVLYPICLGEVLNDRYLVEHKIGSGGFSAVWMAHDLQDKRDVALKVMSLRTKFAENELRIQDEILRKVQDTSRLVTYLTTFLLSRDGNEGQHRVLVYPLVGPCLDPTMLRLRKMPMATLMSAAKQLLLALESLHKAGIVHRGELLSCLSLSFFYSWYTS